MNLFLKIKTKLTLISQVSIVWYLYCITHLKLKVCKSFSKSGHELYGICSLKDIVQPFFNKGNLNAKYLLISTKPRRVSGAT